jgi:hypothetical protein
VDGHSTSQGAANGDANGAHGDDLAHRREASGAAYPASTDRQALSAPCALRCGRRGALCRWRVSSLPATCALSEASLLSVGAVSPLARPCHLCSVGLAPPRHLSASHTHLLSPPAPVLPAPALPPRPTTPREVAYDLGKWKEGKWKEGKWQAGRTRWQGRTPTSVLPMGPYAHDSLRDEA